MPWPPRWHCLSPMATQVASSEHCEMRTCTGSLPCKGHVPSPAMWHSQEEAVLAHGQLPYAQRALLLMRHLLLAVT